MGLDMYFAARRYLWDWPEDPKENPDITLSKNILALLGDMPDHAHIEKFEIQFGYWRKASAIHGWFVNHIQDGKDKCQTSFVSREDINLLLLTLNKVLEDRSLAPTLLPTMTGFFFGGQKYDDYYWQQVEYTKMIMTNALDPKMEKFDFSYRASW